MSCCPYLNPLAVFPYLSTFYWCKLGCLSFSKRSITVLHNPFNVVIGRVVFVDSKVVVLSDRFFSSSDVIVKTHNNSWTEYCSVSCPVSDVSAKLLRKQTESGHIVVERKGAWAVILFRLLIFFISTCFVPYRWSMLCGILPMYYATAARSD